MRRRSRGLIWKFYASVKFTIVYEGYFQSIRSTGEIFFQKILEASKFCSWRHLRKKGGEGGGTGPPAWPAGGLD
jgi:hypothetical protein